MNEVTGEGTDAASPMHDRVLATCATLKAQAAVASRAARVLAPLGKPKAYEDNKQLDKLLVKVNKGLAALQQPVGIATDVLAAIEAWRRARKDSLRQQLDRELKAACEAAGVSLRTISREAPVEVRIPPLSVVIDFDRARADLRFAKEVVGSCAADAHAVVDAWVRTKTDMERGFMASTFFEQCLAAWRAAKAATGANDRVELLDFLPFLALLRQPSKFRSAPIRENFVSYSRAQFAFDVLLLRRERSLAHNGMRMNFGVATGTTASDKKRVIYLEDEEGNGEYKLTVFFTKEEQPA